MDKLTPEQQAEIKKMSSTRIVTRLAKAGYSEEQVEGLDRPKLLDLWAECVQAGESKPATSTLATVDPEVEKMRLQIEMMRMQCEESRRREEMEKEERKRREETEWRRYEEEREERKRKDERERMKMEVEQRRYEEEKIERERRYREEMELRQRELDLRERETERQRERDERDARRQLDLTRRTKQYFDAFKGLLSKLPNDPAEIIGYFEHLEGLFQTYEVPDDIKPKILQAHLNEKARSLVVRLSRDQLNDYAAFKEFLLNEYRVTPTQLRERFFSLNKKVDETYVNLASNLHNAWMYYTRSRNIDRDFEQLVSLICADRLKDLIPRSCLDWILSQEDVKKGSWLDHQALATAADTYMASHYPDGKPKFSSTAPQFKYFERRDTKNDRAFSETSTSTAAAASPTHIGRGNLPPGWRDSRRCFNCQATGTQFHLARDCPKRNERSENRKHTRVNACTVENQPSTAAAEPQPEFQEDLEFSDPAHIARMNAQAISTVELPSETVSTCRDVKCHDDACNCIAADQYFERAYYKVSIEGINQPLSALADGGANYCVIDRDLVKDLNLPVVKQVRLSGLQGQAGRVNVVKLHVKPMMAASSGGTVNIAPPVKVWFAVVPGLNESVILTPSVVELLKTVESYDILESNSSDDKAIENAVIPFMNIDNDETELKQPIVSNSTAMTSGALQNIENNEPSVIDDSNDEFCDVENIANDRVASNEVLAAEQKACPTLHECWKLAEQNRGGFFVDHGLLYHRETILGHRISQLVLPEGRRKTVMEYAHDAPFAGHLAWQRTRYRTRLAFYWPKMTQDIRHWCITCEICQKHKPIRVADRVPIKPIPRDDELPFTHLVIDCIGPIIPEGDPTIPKPEYNYALVAVDRFTRYPMAYPLRSMSAKAVCDCLLTIFMTYSIPKVISSDCGTNFTSLLTRECLKRLGCSPRFNTPGHPESSGLVERCNASLKTAIFKLCQGDPKGWHRLLPFVVWSLREVPNSTTHVSPYMLLFGTLPRGPLTVLKESWAGERELPFSIGKRPEEYLQLLKENLEIAQAYASIHAKEEQQKYAAHYNLRSSDRKFHVGDRVVALAPITSGGRKYYSRWQGPGIVTEVRSPYSYVVEVDGSKRHLHANKIRKFHERIQEAMINNCSVIFDKDDEFGTVEVVEPPSINSNSLPSRRIDAEKVAHLTHVQKRQLFEVLDKFPEVFSEKPGFYSGVEHEIKITPGFEPKRLREYRVPELLKPEVDRQIHELLELGIIRPSCSEMASPVVCVLKGPKGENGVRLAVDYRYVNKHSSGDSYPIPDISDVLQKVSRVNFISTFDAKSGYWQIPVKPECQWLTCFICASGLFEFVRMPFGLKSASNTFIRAVSQILEPIKDFTEAFVDDMAVLSQSWEQHLTHLESYLAKIKESGLTLGLKKCSFAQPKAKFVGHVVGSGLIEPDPVKLATIPNIEPPVTKKDVRKMMGFFNYFRSFVPSFAETAKVITDLTQKHMSTRVKWEEKHQLALDKLKLDLQKSVQHPLHSVEYGKDFGLLVDASATAVGGCLIQWNEEGTERPLAFASMKLSPTQSRWATIEREAFAVIWALRKYRSWIFRSKVTVFSDHNPLAYLTESAPKSAKLARWALALQEFDLTFRYRPARQNAAADFLSRI